MSGLLNMGPQDEALLALGLGLLNSKGSFGNALGQSGMQAMQTLNQAKEREQRARQQAQQEEMQRMQVEQMRRQATLDTMTPTMKKPDFMDNRDVGQPGEAQPAPDLGGLAQQYMMAPGGLSRGLQLQEMLKKQKPAPIKLGVNERLLEPETNRELVPAMPDKDAGSPLAKLIAERDKFPPGHPARKVYDNAITKATTHQPGTSVSVNTGQKGLDNTLKLRGDFRSEPIYKAHQDVQSAHSQITTSLKQNSPAGDLAGATKIMKILDPGSVVRESELGMAMAASGALDRMVNYADMTIRGTKLTPDQRKDFQALADKLFKESERLYNAKRAEYKGIASRNSLPVEDVLGPEPRSSGWSIRPVE
jgi:hypothetical protein